MAETGTNEEEHTFPVKRKPNDIPSEETHEEDVNKKQKLGTSDSTPTQENKLDDAEDDEEDYEGEDEDEEGDDDDADDADDELENGEGEREIDRKGKGILRDDKGKGKLIEDSDDDDDSSDFGSESDADTDMSDDLLAEVDLGNIIPSRTRRRTFQSGLKISDNSSKGDKCDGSDA